ncbi:MAG: GAF domain-containing protein [Beijerinckiaceae bacterium]
METARTILGDFSMGRTTAQEVHRAVCGEIIKHVEATRASVWYFNSFRDEITCACLLDARTGEFTQGAVLREDDFPEYFAAIREHTIVNAPDAMNHPATRCFDELYFLPNNISSLLDVVISANRQQVAVLCCEHCGDIREWRKADITYLEQMAILLRLSFLVEQRLQVPNAA